MLIQGNVWKDTNEVPQNHRETNKFCEEQEMRDKFIEERVG